MKSAFVVFIAFALLFPTFSFAEEGSQLELEWTQKNRVAVELFVQGKHREALFKMEEALQYAEEAFGHHSLQYAKTLNNLGNLHLQMGAFDAAKENYQMALEIEEKLLGSEDSMIADSLFNLAMVYAVRNEHSKVKELLMQSKTIHLMQPDPHQESIQRIDQILKEIDRL